MRSSLLIVVVLARVAAAQGRAPDDLPPPPPDDAEPQPDPEPAPPPAADPVPDAPDPAPAADPAPPAEPTAAPLADDADKVTKKKFDDRGLVLGFEIGFGAPGGTSSDVYGPGLGTGFIVGYHYQRVTLEWHFHHSHAVRAKQMALRGETTQGEVGFEAVLARVKLVDDPVVVEVVGGPAMLSVPQLRIGEDDLGEQVVDTKNMRGIGLVVGGFAGHRVGRYVVLGLELRATVAASWEMPGDAYVVPGAATPDGGVMYTESAEDASGKPWSATAVMRILL